jgi:DNA-directed RNA polymerase specialized sigma24 family protein
VATDVEATIAELDDAFAVRAIREALRIPSGTIASRISRCLGKLREELQG